MHDQAFTILEYHDLRQLIRRGAQTPMGQARVDALAPLRSIDDLRQALLAVAECVDLRKRGVSWRFSELGDPSDRIALLRVAGTTLEIAAILELKLLSEQAMAARASILAERDMSPVLWNLVASLPADLSRLSARIANKILPSGELDDRASPELARIRHEIGMLRSRITRTLESVMRRSGEAIQDELVTIRNDRFVIPVKSDHRARVSGVAHGYSSSGATAFIEARHPLLEENLRASAGLVVPVSFSLDEQNDTMVISGANAGGKTVVLKTAGLLALMALSGVPVSAREAKIPFYASVLADIGDHQSLAANLSTFTSHIANLPRIIEIREAPALALLHE